MESRSLKVWPVAWINRLSSRVTRPHPRLRSFECSRFLHPFSSRGYAGILQNSNPPFLFSGGGKKEERISLGEIYSVPAEEFERIREEDRMERWKGKKSAANAAPPTMGDRYEHVLARGRCAREVTVRKIGDGVPTERSARFGRELNRPRLSCYRPLRVIKFPAVFTGQWPRPGRRGIQSP